MDPNQSEKVAAFWDENRRTVTLDPAFWMAHPLCREAINRRIGGNPLEWTLDRFRRLHSSVPYERGISWGCGLGAFERWVVRLGIAREVDAFDLSPASVADAAEEARKEGIPGAHFRVGDFNDPKIERGRYDVVFFHQSLHHVSALERLFRRLAISLQPGAAIYVDEFVGPSRFHWKPGMLDLAQSVLDRLPPEIKLARTLEAPIAADDPSEAIRSDEIAGFVREFFDIEEWRPYGGQIVDLVFPAISREWAHSPEGCRATIEMLKIEDEELAAKPEASHHLYAFGHLKPKRRLVVALAKHAFRPRLPEGPS
ncbi:MAG: class I SAM-dependent methyltransferase [Thermoanaerobaculia bacterium]